VRSNFIKDQYQDQDHQAASEKEGEGDDDVIYKDSPMKPVGKSRKEVEYIKTINRLLPPDVRALAWSPVTKDFNARYLSFICENVLATNCYIVQ
jgi:hypothetical protein